MSDTTTPITVDDAFNILVGACSFMGQPFRRNDDISPEDFPRVHGLLNNDKLVFYDGFGGLLRNRDDAESVEVLQWDGEETVPNDTLNWSHACGGWKFDLNEILSDKKWAATIIHNRRLAVCDALTSVEKALPPPCPSDGQHWTLVVLGRDFFRESFYRDPVHPDIAKAYIDLSWTAAVLNIKYKTLHETDKKETP